MATKKSAPSADLLRAIPSVDQLLSDGEARALVQAHGRELVTRTIREVLGDLRTLLKGGNGSTDLSPAAVLRDVRSRIEQQRRSKLCRVVNATGVILHTGLGRAVLPAEALEAIHAEQAGYSLLEVDRDSGDRTIREVHVAELLRVLTGAEAATVVNNNAGATMIALATLAQGKEVIVSRGQLVEIGGSFRIPDVMEQSGCTLVDVGTTNKTRLSDYAKKIRAQTALLLRVHTSNYRIVGFTETASLEDLIALGKKHGLPVMDDLGSGSLVDLAPYGIEGEPVVQESVKAGADVITFSGDKLLGGPQAGILIGKKKVISAIRANPLFRALRIDKLTLTALEATLKLYLDPDRLVKRLPTLRMIAMAAAELEQRAQAMAASMASLPSGWQVEVRADHSQIGGGSVPAQNLPTRVVAVRHGSLSAERIDRYLRANDPCIFARVQKDRVLFDARTLLDGDAEAVVAALRAMQA